MDGLHGYTKTLIRLLGGDLSRPYPFIRVAKAVAELGRDNDVPSWATRKVAVTNSWQVALLYHLAVGVTTPWQIHEGSKREDLGAHPAGAGPVLRRVVRLSRKRALG